jgi:putative ABC transport system substrate-binding protein
MRRRDFIALLGSVATGWPLTGRAQQPVVPVIGFLRSTPSAPFAHLVTAFRDGLKEAGFVEGSNLAIEYRWADNDPDRLPGLAADLVSRQVAVIVGNSVAVEAARAATQTIPIVFVAADDPVKTGLVESLHRPEKNLTGVTFFGGGHLNVKRLELLMELAPKATLIAVLLDPTYPAFEAELPNVIAAARFARREVLVLRATTEREFEAAFAELVQAGVGALLVSGSAAFTSRRHLLVMLAARHAIPTIYDVRDHVTVGGLVSYGANLADAYRQAGTQVGRILKGAKPSEVPVLQPTRFELVVNLRTAKALGLIIPPTLLARADEVIE